MFILVQLTVMPYIGIGKVISYEQRLFGCNKT